jgi:cyclopropane-fatty-acyl-phospholipid synthase
MNSSELATAAHPRSAEPAAVRLAERGWLPDGLLRLGMRRLIRERLRSLDAAASEAFIAGLAAAPIAPVPALANAQHYELPPAFFERVLGPQLKYSCCLFDDPDMSLAKAEAAMLELCSARARIADGMKILDLGCGWGSLSLWLARRHPRARITAVSNSKLQREFISARARSFGLDNLEVLTADVNAFAPAARFDRIASVEMLEHTRNWPLLLGRMAEWLEPDGEAFIHVFCQREFAYPFETAGRGDWMGRHFFSGGMMPSLDLMERCAGALSLAERWTVAGTHYERTARAWLANLDARRAEIREVLAGAYGRESAELWLNRWRLFFLAVAELFGFEGGTQWLVAHYRLARAEAK